MRRASRIMLLVGSIFSLVTAGVCFACAVVFTVLAIADVGTDDAQIVFIALAATFAVCMVFAFLAGLFARKAREEKTPKAYIIAIVFSAMTYEFVTIAGAVLGLIASKKDSRVIDVKAK